MRRFFGLLMVLLLISLPVLALGQSRALLVACHDFIFHARFGKRRFRQPAYHRFFAGRCRHERRQPVHRGRHHRQHKRLDPCGKRCLFRRGGKRPLHSSISARTVCFPRRTTDRSICCSQTERRKPRSTQRICRTMPLRHSGRKAALIDACYSGALIGRGVFSKNLLPGCAKRRLRRFNAFPRGFQHPCADLCQRL